MTTDTGNKDSGKKAFTLAEVLITLGIIGVVAAMTIPALATHLTHRKLQSQFKKTYSDLNQAARLFYAEEESSVHDYDSFISDSSSKNADNVLKKFMSYFKSQSKSSGSMWKSFDANANLTNLNLSGEEISSYPCDQTAVYSILDGRLIALDDTSTNYNYDHGPKICVDINGIDKPNRWGYDRFVFVFTADNAVVPYTGTSWSDLTKQYTDETTIAQYCSYTLTQPAHSCAYFALNDKSPDGSGSYWYNFLK